jgi:hypothetical protein
MQCRVEFFRDAISGAFSFSHFTPLMLKTPRSEVNFVRQNALENMRSQPKMKTVSPGTKSSPFPPKHEDFGKIPQYLLDKRDQELREEEER